MAARTPIQVGILPDVNNNASQSFIASLSVSGDARIRNKDDTHDSRDLERKANQGAGVGHTLLRIWLGSIHSSQAHTFTFSASSFLSLVVDVVELSG